MGERGCLGALGATFGLMLILGVIVTMFRDPLSPWGIAGWIGLGTLIIIGVVGYYSSTAEEHEQRLAEAQQRDAELEQTNQRDLLDDVRYYLAVVEDRPDPSAAQLARLQFNQLNRREVGWQVYRDLERRLERIEGP